ncbi:MAG: hypothetical protein M1827_004749 [Pycnora praestabilis]|nr:MAG: hypothetical protein M1827_004749 [Pycnora praestabilis]
MLSRGTSDAATRLRRAKSTSSVRKRRHSPPKSESMHLEIAHHHALAAASYAFTRAGDRPVAATDGDVDIQRNHMRSSRHGNDDESFPRTKTIRYFDHALTDGRQSSLNRSKGNTVGPGVTSVRNDSTTAVERSSQVVSSAGRAESILSGTTAFNQHLTPEDNIASAPSSYRKLRKAKSMFGPRKATSIIYNNDTPEHSKVRRQIGPGASDVRARQGTDLRAPKSMSFLRSSQSPAPRPVLKIGQDEAIQVARDRYLEQLEMQRLKEQSRSAVPSIPQRQQKPFRRTVRTSSETSYGGAIASANQEDTYESKRRRFGGRARNLSISIKNKLKRVFHRSSEDEKNLPVQHLDASRPHFGNYASPSSGLDVDYHEVPQPEEEILSRVNSRVPSLRTTPSNPLIRSQAASIRSMYSEDNDIKDKSRVTSWTNSTAANTMIERHYDDLKRLSIIQENGGPHQSSSSSGRFYTGPSNYAAFQGPMHEIQRDVGRVTGPVDSHRVYSALMKRLEENKPTSRHAKKDSIRGGKDHGNGLGSLEIPSRPLSVASQRTMATIRPVQDDDDASPLPNIRPSKSVHLNSLPFQVTDDVFAPEVLPETPRGRRSKSQQIRSANHIPRKASKDSKDSANCQSLQYPGSRLGLTPQQAADLNERMRMEPKHRLKTVKSSLYPSSAGTTTNTSDSYRHSIGAKPDAGDSTEQLPGDLFVMKHPRVSKKSPIPRQSNATGSASIYSRSTNSNAPKPAGDRVASGAGSEHIEPGTAMIITTRSTKHPVNASSTSKRGRSSSRLSNDWKAWMSSQVATLEKENAVPVELNEADRSRAPGHRREEAQIDGEDTKIANSKSVTTKQPLAAVAGNILSRPMLKHKASEQQMFPLIHIGPPPGKYNLPQRPSSRNNSNYAGHRLPSVPEKENVLVAGSAYPKIRTVRSIASQSSLPCENLYTCRFDTSPGNGSTRSIRLNEQPRNNEPKANRPASSVANWCDQLRPGEMEQSSGIYSSGFASPKSDYEGCFIPVHSQQDDHQIVHKSSQFSFSEGDGVINTGGLSRSAGDSSPTGSQRLVDLLLNKRRNSIKISEDDGE